MNIIGRALTFLGLLLVSVMPVGAVTNTQTDTLSFYLAGFTRIEPITSPVLTANITDRTGNLHSPLIAKFRVITNSSKTRTFYLNAKTTTESGFEDAMFEQGGQVYVAFANLSKAPQSSSLANCKYGGMPKDSPGVVAYPITSVIGAEHKYIPQKNKYEVYIGNGTTDVTVNVGSHVLRNSFASNDPKGFYQAVISLTEADI